MKVSVIIPTYNRGHYICQAIESVLQQTMKDIEIIVIDDGSTDNTREAIAPYQNRMKYIYTENGGPAHARNLGMKMARGEYISFLDSDDLYYPYKIELQYELLERFHDAGMVYTEFSGFDDKGFWDEYHLKNYHSSAYKNGKMKYENIFSESTTFNNAGLDYPAWADRKIYFGNIFNAYFNHIIVFTNSIMFRRKFLKTIGMLDERYGLYDLSDFVLRICKRHNVVFTDIPTYKLRYHTGQISGITKREGIDTVIRKQYELLDIGEKHGVNDREYYSANKGVVNKRLAVLHKALAVPLLAKGNKPRIARDHLRKSANYGYPEQFLFLLTFVPYIVRRIAVKVLSILKMN
jgi:glycosyltransferase involved in cell wall biosynthesis